MILPCITSILFEGGAPPHDARVDLTAVAHTRLSVIAEKRNDAGSRAAHRRDPGRGAAAAEEQRRPRLDLDRAHALRSAVDRSGHGGVILPAVGSDIRSEVEGSARFRRLQQNGGDEIADTE